jgi:CheY-like chemotaxis protein
MGGLSLDRRNVRALHPLRVLLAARDRRFVNVAGLLLERGGYSVLSTRRPRDIVPLVERHRPDVVILDGSSSLTEAARVAGVIGALHPHVTVAIAADNGFLPSVDGIHVFSKWDSLGELVANIERLHLGVSP